MTMREKIQEDCGAFLLKTALKILACAIFLSAGISIFHIYHSLGVVREKTNEAVLAVAAVNVAEFYAVSILAGTFRRCRHCPVGTIRLDSESQKVPSSKPAWHCGGR